MVRGLFLSLLTKNYALLDNGEIGGTMLISTKWLRNGGETTNMKATVIHNFGDFDVFKHEDIKRPSPKPGYV
jgi:hypothetical protein